MKVTLRVEEHNGRLRDIPLSSSRFSVGRGDDNDLSIDDNGVSRRHALIETFGDGVQVSDCGSQNGTFLNGEPVAAPVTLRHGDLIEIGPSCKLFVRFDYATVDNAKPLAEGDRQRPSTPRDMSPSQGSKNIGLPNPLLIAGGAGLLIVLVAILVIIVNRKPDDDSRDRRVSRVYKTTNGNFAAAQSPSADESVRLPEGADGMVTIDKIEKTARLVMRRISSDDRAYSFASSQALEDIKRKVDEYRTAASLPGMLLSVSQHGADVAKQARSQGLEPDLLIYVALAETDGGRTGRDAIGAARSALPVLAQLRVTFGTEEADNSLLLVAAYRMSPGTKKSHPLISKMRQIIKNPTTDRNVWYVHDHGAIDNQTYEFVLQFLALGIIAQDPVQFGVAAAALPF